MSSTILFESDDLWALFDELIDMWDEHGRPNDLSQPKARRGQAIMSTDVARMELVLGLSRHVYETARSIRLLLDNGHLQSAIPLVRLAYECALTSVWLVQSEGDEAVKAFIHEYARGNKYTQENLRRAVSQSFRDGADAVADVDLAPFAGSLDNARRFDLLCDDLEPAGADAYVYYRIMSAYSHASVRVTDLYFEVDPEGGPVPGMRDAARVPMNEEILLFLTCATMVWSARPITYLSKDKTYRSYLRRAGQQIGVTSEIQLSQAYHQRHAAARKAAHAKKA